ncbi:hypothetical protein C0J52_08548 [Blattella germanica]|nr:hypothetical protein C0J52_08548 [Blattella germanica]
MSACSLNPVFSFDIYQDGDYTITIADLHAGTTNTELKMKYPSLLGFNFNSVAFLSLSLLIEVQMGQSQELQLVKYNVDAFSPLKDSGGYGYGFVSSFKIVMTLKNTPRHPEFRLQTWRHLFFCNDK